MQYSIIVAQNWWIHQYDPMIHSIWCLQILFNICKDKIIPTVLRASNETQPNLAFLARDCYSHNLREKAADHVCVNLNFKRSKRKCIYTDMAHV